MRTSLKLFGFGLTVALLFVACDGSSSSTSPNSGRLSVRMTDAPTDEVSAVNVYVTGLTVKHSEAPVQRIANDIGLIDLLSLQGTTQELVSLGVAAGDYEFIMVELDESLSHVVLVDGGGTAPLRIASEEVKVLGGFHVPEGGDTVVTLDFDAAQSLRKQGNDDWLLVPVILMLGPPAP